MIAPEGVLRRRLWIATMILLGAAALFFTGLAVSSAMSHGRSWALPLISQVVGAVLVWLLLRNRGRRAVDGSARPTTQIRSYGISILLGVAGLALMGLALLLVYR